MKTVLRPLLLASMIGALTGCQPAEKTTMTMKTNNQSSEPATSKVAKTDEEWRKVLTPEQYRVLRQAGTERAFSAT